MASKGTITVTSSGTLLAKGGNGSAGIDNGGSGEGGGGGGGVGGDAVVGGGLACCHVLVTVSAQTPGVVAPA